jgi:DNA ligase-1
MRRPMKGAAIEETDFDKLIFPIYGAPKIDGFRCVLSDRPLTSRLSPFPNAHFDRTLKGLLEEPLLDAEVVVGSRKGKGVLGRTSSGLTSKQGEPDFTLWCFDTPQVGYCKRDRLQLTQQIVDHLDHPNIRFLKHKLLHDRDELEAYLSLKLEQEYEGIMLYSPIGDYKFGKGTLREQVMLKVKPFDTAEGRIKGWFEEEQNTNEAKREQTGKLKRSSSRAGKVGKGRLGGFILEDCKTGVEVRVGGGFTKAQRIGLWKVAQETPELLLKKLVRYKKQRVGEKDKPRHPGFVEFSDFRPEWDFIEED